MWCEHMLSVMLVHCWQLAQGQCYRRSVSGVVCGVNTCYPSCLYIAVSWLKDSVMGRRLSGVVCGVNTCYPSCLYIAGSRFKDSVMGGRCQELYVV